MLVVAEDTGRAGTDYASAFLGCALKTTDPGVCHPIPMCILPSTLTTTLTAYLHIMPHQSRMRSGLTG